MYIRFYKFAYKLGKFAKKMYKIYENINGKYIEDN